MEILPPVALEGLQGQRGGGLFLPWFSGGRNVTNRFALRFSKTIIFTPRYLQWMLWLSIRLANYRFKISGSINTHWLMLFSATNYLQVPRHESTFNTFVNFRICFLHHYLSINRIEQTAVPKAGWISYYDLFINKKNAYTIRKSGLLISTVKGWIPEPLIYEALSSKMHTLFCLGWSLHQGGCLGQITARQVFTR